jgi:hypothetical protein
MTALASPIRMARARIHVPVPAVARPLDIALPDMSATWGGALDTPEQLELQQQMQRLKAIKLLTQ